MARQRHMSQLWKTVNKRGKLPGIERNNDSREIGDRPFLFGHLYKPTIPQYVSIHPWAGTQTLPSFIERRNVVDKISIKTTSSRC